MNVHNNYLFITRQTTWPMLLSNPLHIWPISTFNLNKALKINPGQEVIIYLTRLSAFAGIVQVTGQLSTFPSGILVDGVYYKHYLPVEFKLGLDFEDTVSIKDILNQLDLTRNKKNWGSILQTAIKRISDNDYILIKEKLRVKENVQLIGRQVR